MREARFTGVRRNLHQVCKPLIFKVFSRPFFAARGDTENNRSWSRATGVQRASNGLRDPPGDQGSRARARGGYHLCPPISRTAGCVFGELRNLRTNNFPTCSLSPGVPGERERTAHDSGSYFSNRSYKELRALSALLSQEDKIRRVAQEAPGVSTLVNIACDHRTVQEIGSWLDTIPAWIAFSTRKPRD